MCHPEVQNDDEATLDLEKETLLGSTLPNRFETAERFFRFSPRIRRCFYLAIAIVGWMILRRFVQTTVSIVARWIPDVDVEHPMAHRTPAEVKDIYAQYRDTKRMGTSEDYVEVNTYQDKHLQRIEAMRQLDMVRFGVCGDFEQAVAAHHKEDNPVERSMIGGTRWKFNPAYMFTEDCKSGTEYKAQTCDQPEGERYVCEAPHPTRKDVTVTIERFGPFTGKGGYDWIAVNGIRDIGMLQERMVDKNFVLVGGMVAPTTGNGTIIGYPPIHIHHAHVFPYGGAGERAWKIHGSHGDHHDVVFQAHGDSECHADEGGVACLLTQLEEGDGFVVQNSTTGISGNFELNDVRPKGSPTMEYWFEVALLHTPNPPQKKRSTYIGINNPCIGTGPCIYTYPMDPHNNAMWYQYTHGGRKSDLTDGTISDFVLHTHQTIFDSAFLIKTDNDNIFNAFERFRGKQKLPMILDCHENGMDLEVAKTELLSIVHQHQGLVVCEATKPSLVFVEGEDGELHGRDKRAKLNCLKGPVPLKKGDHLVVLAFNSVHENKYTRKSKAFREQNVFSNYFAVYQHTIFRFIFSQDKDVAYAPPSYFFYAENPIPFLLQLVWSPHGISATCPSTIQYRMRSKFLDWFIWIFGIKLK